jgi:hypothetical protein
MVPDAVVQDRRPDTLPANDEPTSDDLIVIRLEEVAAKAARVRDVEKMASEAVVVEAGQVQARDVEEIAMEEMVVEAVKALPEPEGRMNTTVRATISTF